MPERPALPRTASERAPLLALRKNWQGRHTFSYPKPACDKPKSHRRLQCPLSADGALGVTSTRPEKEPQVFAEHPPAQLTHSAWSSHPETVLRKALTAGNTALRSPFVYCYRCYAASWDASLRRIALVSPIRRLLLPPEAHACVAVWCPGATSTAHAAVRSTRGELGRTIHPGRG